MVKFDEKEVRIMGRTASGVKGIELDNATCIGAEIASEEDVVLIVTENGYGKQTKVCEYRQTKRGSKGVKALSITEKNGNIASFKISKPDKDIVIITDAGMVMRMSLDQINVLGRVTQGVRLIKLKEENKVATVSLVDKEEKEDLGNNPIENQEILGNNPDEIQSDLGNNLENTTGVAGNNVDEETVEDSEDRNDPLGDFEDESSSESDSVLDDDI